MEQLGETRHARGKAFWERRQRLCGHKDAQKQHLYGTSSCVEHRILVSSQRKKCAFVSERTQLFLMLAEAAPCIGNLAVRVLMFQALLLPAFTGVWHCVRFS